MPDAANLMHKAFMLLEIKAVNESARTFEGIASTPTPDLGGDIMDPFGAQFTLPMPLMWQHGKEDMKDPVGWVTHAVPSPDGIRVKGNFAQLSEPASLKDQLDRAWALVKSKLVRGLSIGWQPIKGEPVKGTNFIRWVKWGWHELSAVAMPMNTEATIQNVKSCAAAASSQSVHPRPGASGKPPRSTTMPGITERLSELESKSVEVKTRMSELSTQCDGDVAKLAPEELREFDTLNDERGPLEENIKRYRGMIAAVGKAVPVSAESGSDPTTASRIRQGDFKMKSNLPKGTLFARTVIAKARGRGSIADSIAFAKSAWRDSPEVAQYLQIKANPDTGASGNWGELLNITTVIDSEFIELLRPATILGRLAGLRPATFNTKMIRATGGTTVQWTGRAAPKPVGEMAFDFVTIDIAKCAGIVVLTEEQVMISHPNADMVVSNDLVQQVAQFLDVQFTDPTVSAVAGTNPASVTNGVNDVASSGTTANDLRLDLKKALSFYAAANMGVAGLTIITTSYVAMGISLLVNALGQPEFPTVTMNGGSLMGMPIIVSDNVPGSSTSSLLILIKPSEVFLADAGGVAVDVSREATLDMAGGSTPAFSLWQNNCVGLRAERFISWQKRRPAAVQYISGAAYAPAA